MYWDSYIIRSFYNNGGNVIFNKGTGTATSSDLSIIMGKCYYNISRIIIERSDDVAVPVHIFNITFPPLL
jgi:hypothetical protein